MKAWTFGYGVRNLEGEKIIEFRDAMGMIVCGTQFQTNNNKQIMYLSGGIGFHDRLFDDT